MIRKPFPLILHQQIHIIFIHIKCAYFQCSALGGHSAYNTRQKLTRTHDRKQKWEHEGRSFTKSSAMGFEQITTLPFTKHVTKVWCVSDEFNNSAGGYRTYDGEVGMCDVSFSLHNEVKLLQLTSSPPHESDRKDEIEWQSAKDC